MKNLILGILCYAAAAFIGLTLVGGVASIPLWEKGLTLEKFFWGVIMIYTFIGGLVGVIAMMVGLVRLGSDLIEKK